MKKEKLSTPYFLSDEMCQWRPSHTQLYKSATMRKAKVWPWTSSSSGPVWCSGEGGGVLSCTGWSSSHSCFWAGVVFTVAQNIVFYQFWWWFWRSWRRWQIFGLHLGTTIWPIATNPKIPVYRILVFFFSFLNTVHITHLLLFMAPVSLCIFCWVIHIRCYRDGLKIMIDLVQEWVSTCQKMTDAKHSLLYWKLQQSCSARFALYKVRQRPFELSCLTFVCGDSFNIKMTWKSSDWNCV